MDNIKAIILAAGKGTRLHTEGVDLPKVMRLALNKPLLRYVTEAISFIEPDDTIIVAGYKKESVIEAFPGYHFATQKEQLGTGHAVMAASGELKGYGGAVLICYGDMPLFRTETYLELIRTHIAGGYACTLLTGTSHLALPYGRIVRSAAGDFSAIVEDRDASDAERAITELNSGIYVFSAPLLLRALADIKNDNTQGEYYLTDAPKILQLLGFPVGVCKRDLGDEIIGVNNVEQLAMVESILKERGGRGASL